ncbi:MAG: hypothetical protein IKH31_07770 [Clostridia bacterium]|jgi:stage IV sporulation protein FB|nr:hypothetical protein [Clostridia bacterium]MBR3487444.1 hypothetical protein [Clostridia bacterium]
MKLFSIGGTKLKCSPLLIAAIPVSCLFGRAALMLVALVSLSVHEAAHALVAARLGLRVYSLELMPFGAAARIDARGAPRKELAAVWAAGPAASLIMAGMSALAERAVPAFADAKLGLTEFNALLAAVNLLPAMPLDGGRLLYELVRSRRALKAAKALGVITGCAFIAVFCLLLAHGLVNITFAVMGVFLIAAAVREREPAVPPDPARLLRFGTPLEIAQLAVSDDTRLIRALRLMPRGAYSVIVAVDKDGRRRGELEAGELRRAALVLGADAKLADAVALKLNGML